MQCLLYNPVLSNVYFTYRKIGGSSTYRTEGRLDQVWPAGHDLVQGVQREVAVLSANALTPSQAACLQHVLYVRPQQGDAPLPPVPPATVIQVPPIKVANKNFKRRSKKGEVIMSPYRVGTVEYQRRLVAFPQRPVKYPSLANQQAGYMAVQPGAVGPFGVWPPCPLPSPGYQLASAGCLIKWSWTTIPVADVVLSPDPSVINFTPRFEYDPGIVTSTVADCNNGVYDILTEALELPSTFSFLSEEFKKIANVTADTEEAARAMRKKLKPAAFAKWLSSHWLKYRYAVMPLFYSVSDIASVLKQVGREYEAFRDSIRKTDLPFDVPPGLRFGNEVECLHRCMIKTRYTTDSLLDNLCRLLNANLASSAWELTTFSFVYDWVVNIGDYIAALTGDSGATELKCSYSIRYFGNLDVAYDTDDPRFTDVTTTVKVNLYDRTIINPSDHIGLQVGLDMTWKRIVDAFALATNPAVRRIRAIRN